jgi:hypothetical protein
VAANALSRAFNNWFYAGWVISEKAGIAPKTVRGQWKPMVSTEEFERGQSILMKRQKHRRGGGRVHSYLLTGILYVQLDDGKLDRLMGSTPNAGRPGGGTAYYCIQSSNINIPCHQADQQIEHQLIGIQVNPAMLTGIRESYTDEVQAKLSRMRPNQRVDLEKQLTDLENEEARVLRLYASGKITEKAWDNLWLEWQDRRRSIEQTLASLQADSEVHLANLDAALTIISKVGILYRKLERSDKRMLLREIVGRIVVNCEGEILRVELLPPFAYLREIADRMRNVGEVCEGKTKTGTMAGSCSSNVSYGSPKGIRAVS